MIIGEKHLWLVSLIAKLSQSEFKFVLGGKHRFGLADHNDAYVFYAESSADIFTFLTGMRFQDTKHACKNVWKLANSSIKQPDIVMIEFVKDLTLIEEMQDIIVELNAEGSAVHPEHAATIWNMAATLAELRRSKNEKVT